MNLKLRIELLKLHSLACVSTPLSVSNMQAIDDGWITLNGGSGEDEHGGSRVFVGQGGQIEKGAGSLVGKKLSDLSGKKKFTKYETNAEHEQSANSEPAPKASETSNNETISPASQNEAGKSGDKTMNSNNEKQIAAIKKVFGEGVHQDFINEVLNGTAQMPASRKKELDKAMGVKKEVKDLHPMINHRADGSFGVKIPFDLKDAFKKQFSSAKFDSATKEWTVGKLSSQKLNDWLQDKIPHIEEKAAIKADFEAKKAEMHPLTGNTFDLKDELKEKFGAIYDGDAKTWRVPPEHKESAQKLVNEHKTARAEKRKLDNAPLTQEENARVEKWMEENPDQEDLMMDDRYMRTIAKGGSIEQKGGFSR